MCRLYVKLCTDLQLVLQNNCQNSTNPPTDIMVCLHCPTSKSIKMTCIGVCGGFHTIERPTTTQSPIDFRTNFITLGPFVDHCQCEHTTSRTCNE